MVERAIEFFVIFFVAPLLLTLNRNRVSPIPVLWLFAGGAFLILRTDVGFDMGRMGGDMPQLLLAAPQMALFFGIMLALGGGLILRHKPDVFLDFPRSKPGLWALVMVLYPVFSVYPQSILYRAFIFHRYQNLFGNGWGLVLASGLAFAFVHIVFRNPLAVILTFPGGLLFAFRYLQTGSLVVSSLEHSLYGCALFTVGLGSNFYHGAARR